MAMLIGAAVATFPASFLLDAFGRRASFALGASHGVAGGLVLAWALGANAFLPFCLGAFWLGVAQGFGLFYRHEAAMGGGAMGRAMLLGVVFGSGALAGLVGPAILMLGAIAHADIGLCARGFRGGAGAGAGARPRHVLRAACGSDARRRTAPRAYDWREALAPTVIGGRRMVWHDGADARRAVRDDVLRHSRGRRRGRCSHGMSSPCMRRGSASRRSRRIGAPATALAWSRAGHRGASCIGRRE